jgi:hypothetical protein
VAGDSLPHADVSWIVELYVFRLLVKAPIHGTYKVHT